MASSSKRQQTMAKRNREQAVKEKAALKLQKKYAAAQERKEKAYEEMFGPRPVANETGLDETEPTETTEITETTETTETTAATETP